MGDDADPVDAEERRATVLRVVELAPEAAERRFRRKPPARERRS